MKTESQYADSYRCLNCGDTATQPSRYKDGCSLAGKACGFVVGRFVDDGAVKVGEKRVPVTGSDIFNRAIRFVPWLLILLAVVIFLTWMQNIGGRPR